MSFPFTHHLRYKGGQSGQIINPEIPPVIASKKANILFWKCKAFQPMVFLVLQSGVDRAWLKRGY